MPFLTYLAQVRQLHFKSAWLIAVHVPIMPLTLLINQTSKYGTSRRAIVTIGIARVAGWEGPNKSTVVWYQVAGHWLSNINFTSSQSLVGEGK